MTDGHDDRAPSVDLDALTDASGSESVVTVLVALAVNLRLARDVIVDDPAAGAEMLEELAGEVQETIQELRELAHGTYPPLLVDSGLVEALRAAANRNPLSVINQTAPCSSKSKS